MTSGLRLVSYIVVLIKWVGGRKYPLRVNWEFIYLGSNY